MCCNLVSLWKNSTLETSQKLQNLLFPEGIIWDKEIGGYRTEKENSALAVMHRITSLCKNNKEEKSVKISSLNQVCTKLTDSRTFIEDLSKIVDFLDWCKDSQISLHWFQEENESCCRKIFSSIFQAKQSLNHLPEQCICLM